jgi:leader peptidase (prepilin peptidase) / N-methyltransferase
MSLLLVTALAVAGLAVGRAMRPVILRYAVRPDEARTDETRAAVPRLAPELTGAILLGASAAVLRPGLVLAAACWLAVCAVPLVWVDAATARLPDVLTAPAYAGTAALLLAAAAAGGRWPDLLRALAGGIALAACYLILHLISPSAVGLGDSKLAASLGTLLAWHGWSTLLAGVVAGFLLGGLYGAALLLLRRATRGQAIPFGPFMIAGAFLAFLAAMRVGP